MMFCQILAYRVEFKSENLNYMALECHIQVSLTETDVSDMFEAETCQRGSLSHRVQS